MKTIEIEINRSDSMEEVSLSTAYTGAKSEGGGDFFDRVATIDEDETLLTRIWRNSCGRIVDRFREFVSSSSVADDFRLQLEVSGSYDDVLTETVKSEIFSAVVSGMLAEWFRYSYPEKSAEWEKKTDGLLTRVHQKLCQRKKPRRSEG